METHIVTSVEEMKSLAGEFTTKLCPGDIVCLHGDLGSGKTTFAQGMLAALGAQLPYTSPTFSILKKYFLSSKTKNGMHTAYHIDAYRITSKDLLDLGWRDIVGDRESVVIIEWPGRVSEIIPKESHSLDFSWKSEHERSVTLPDIGQQCTVHETLSDSKQSPFL
jgi:tRNA threonylcarbamoyladenosine biosynthesis protein TsaE